MRRQDGQALVMVVVVMMILQVIAWAFLARMNFEQRLAGGSTRSLAALYLAEAALQKALVMLEDGTRPVAGADGGSLPYQEALGPGTFRIETLEQRADGVISIIVRGEVAGARRRLEALVRIGPPALAYGLYGQDIVSFDGQARTYLLPFHIGWGTHRRGGDLAAGGEIRFDSPRAALNGFRGQRLPLRDGDIPDQRLIGAGNGTDAAAGLVDLVLAGTAQLLAGLTQIPPRIEELRRRVDELGVRRVTVRPPLVAPSLDVDRYRALAEANMANAEINAATAAASGHPDLRTKAHSRYSAEEVRAIFDYLNRTGRPRPALRGVVFVYGPLELQGNGILTIFDGALVVKGDLTIGQGVKLEVRHGPEVRTLPGVVASAVETAQEGSIFIERDATMAVDGLVLAEGRVEVLGGVLDVIGAIAAKNFANNNGVVVIRYDSGVVATGGLRKTDKGLGEILSWQELP